MFLANQAAGSTGADIAEPSPPPGQYRHASNHTKVSLAPFVYGAAVRGRGGAGMVDCYITIRDPDPADTQGNARIYRGAVSAKIKFRNNKTRRRAAGEIRAGALAELNVSGSTFLFIP